MNNQNILREKMSFIDTFKTASAVGLLMQQSSALHSNEDRKIDEAPIRFKLKAQPSRHKVPAIGFKTPSKILKMNESLKVIHQLDASMREAYNLLLNAEEEVLYTVIERIDPSKANLVEIQLRGLEGAVRNVFIECPDNKKSILKPVLITIARARSSATNLNHLLQQMAKSTVETFSSNIDRGALLALAKHGTEVFVSGRFH